MSFQTWRGNGQRGRRIYRKCFIIKGKERESFKKQKQRQKHKKPLIDKLLPLSSKQGKAGELNHEEITLIIYIVYIVSKQLLYYIFYLFSFAATSPQNTIFKVPVKKKKLNYKSTTFRRANK